MVPTLVAANLLIYFGGKTLAWQDRLDLEDWYDFGHIVATGMKWWQPFTYQFLHDPRSMGHVLSNMVFLWAFGAVVEGRLGRLGFLALYLLGGALAGLVQVWVAGGAAIGASGSVSVVAGAFLALHPRGTVHGFWLLPPMRVAMPAAWLLGLYAAIDLVDTCLDAFRFTDSGVGTIAHLSGLVFGLAVCVVLLGTGVLARN
ncbi:MAG: rhomboid family intramembrane serine protease, partial [Phycisphaerales bacterium]